MSATAPRSRSPTLAGFLSMLVPGTGQFYAGARRGGVALVLLTLAAVCAALLAVRRLDSIDLAASLVRDEVLLGLLAANGLLLLVRALVVADAWRRGRVPGREGRYLQVLALVLLLFLTAAPHALAGYALLTTRSVVHTVFTDHEPEDILLPTSSASQIFLSLPTPPRHIEPGPKRASRLAVLGGGLLFTSRPAWLRGPRVSPRPWTTILLLGGDAGPYRYGLRTDTMIVVALQEKTGKAVALGIPRNLEGAPLTGRAAATVGRFENLLNELYDYAHEHPELFPGGQDPGMTALKQTISNLLGIRIEYVALVDLRGFAELVDAIGGVDVRVNERLYDRLSPPNEGESWITLDLYPGQRIHFDGREALAYARSRSQSSDFTRMARQRCLLSTFAEQLNAGKVLRGFRHIAKAVRGNVRTDIPLRRVPRLIRLIAGVDPGRTVTITLGPPDYVVGHTLVSAHPDIPAIQAIVRKAILRSPKELRRETGVLTVRRSC